MCICRCFIENVWLQNTTWWGLPTWQDSNTGKVTGSYIPQIEFKLLPNLMVALLNPQILTISSLLMSKDKEKQNSGELKSFLRGWMTRNC